VTGRFIVFEGGEASGKSTQARLLAERLGARLTHQPGGTELGAAIRRIVLDPANTDLDARAETLLIAADKAQHLAEVVRPALAQGRDVVCDRYVASSVVYQGRGRGIPDADLAELLRFATGGLVPDLTILLEVPDAVAHHRLGDQRDRFEAEPDAFHARVRAGYRELAAADPTGWVVIDAGGTIAEVAQRVSAAVAARLPVPRP
jgi:dTMP kinase